MLILIGVICKHKRRDKEEQYAMDEVQYNPFPFGNQEMNEDEEDVTVINNVYDSIDNYNVPIAPEGQRHHQVQQTNEDEGQKENTEDEDKDSYDTPLPTQQVGEDTSTVPKGYKELDPDMMMDEIDHKYQGTFANKDDEDYDIPLTLGHHLVSMSNTEKPVAEERYKNVDGKDSNLDERSENVDPEGDYQFPLIIDDDVSDQKTATDEDEQNIGANEDYQSMQDEDDQVSITDEDATLI